MPVWKQSRRVKVDFEHLRLWYQSLDGLRSGFLSVAHH
jgi:hypothetical protein